jgi:hypothetical protein
VTALADEAPPTQWRSWRASALRSHAFGLQLEPGSGADVDARRLDWTLVSRGELDAAWAPARGRMLLERRHPSGRPMLAIEDSDLGFRVAAPGYGRHLVAGDGRSLRSYLPDVPPWRWQRLLFAQVLPLAASLQGLHVAHASAVALDGRVIGFVAPSGTGKTSVCAHLVAQGAGFVTDDVLAVDTAAPPAPLAHPGAAVVAVHRHELAAMTQAGRSRLGVMLGRADKLLLGVEPVDAPLPLERLYFLSRSGVRRDLRVSESAPPDPALLLSSSFLWYLSDMRHSLARLEAAAALAGAVRIFRVDIPAGVPATEVAERLADHATRP